MELVKKVWDDLAAVDSSFFSLFKSTVVESIIRRVTCNTIDYRSRLSTPGNGANLLITGVRGVGKTTLMRGLWSVLSSLQGEKLIAVYHDYETIFELFEMMRRQLPEMVWRTDDFKALLQKLWQARFRVAVFLDEMQTLFVSVLQWRLPDVPRTSATFMVWRTTRIPSRRPVVTPTSTTTSTASIT